MNKLSLNDVLDLHKKIISKFGGRPGVLSYSALDSAINSPFQTYDKIDLYPTIQQKASMICYGVIKCHPFVDGNKRVAILTMLTFLKINNINVKSNKQLIYIVKCISKNDCYPKAIEAWINANSIEYQL